MALRDVKLDDKYDLGHTHVFVTGFQALVRLCLMQKELDRRNGLNTAGYVTGYRGSPLGGLDSQFLRAAPFLSKSDVRFQAGINEDLAATAIWGTQQAELRGEGKYDGVFAMWYGKGPGVDRTGDVFRHANLAGTANEGRRAGADGRRPHRRIVDHRAPVRISLHRRDDPDPQSCRRAGGSRLRPVRLGDVALHRLLGGAQDDARDDRVDGGDRRQLSSGSRSSRRPISRCRTAASTSASTIRSWRRKRGCTISSATPCWRSCAPTRSITPSPRAGAIRRSASSPPARVISTSARRSTNSASTKSNATSSASGFTKWDARGRSAGASWPNSPKASISSSSSRKSARSSKCRCARNCTAPPTSRFASASGTKRATGCSRSRARSIPTKSPSASASGS